MAITDFSKAILKGFGQVMLQNNAITGLLFLLGILLNSWVFALGALIGVLASTITAILLRYKKEEINSGLYGFNGVLIGIAFLLFFQMSALILVLVVLCSALSTVILNYMAGKNIPPYTFPFVFVSWIALALAPFLGVQRLIQTSGIAANLDILSSLTMGLGQVMFQASVLTGLIFFIGILVGSRRAAAFALLGSAAGMAIGLAFSFPLNLVNAGIFGYNGALCGIVFSESRKNPIIYAGAAIVLSVLILCGMLALNLVALTFPFVLAVWIAGAARKRMD